MVIHGRDGENQQLSCKCKFSLFISSGLFICLYVVGDHPPPLLPHVSVSRGKEFPWKRRQDRQLLGKCDFCLLYFFQAALILAFLVFFFYFGHLKIDYWSTLCDRGLS